MYKNKKIIAIIPARGGSKRIPRKNIRLLDNKPLIWWTIKEAKKSRLLDKIIISTEDEEIIKISKDYGAQIVKRPKEFAEDDSPTINSVKQVLLYLEKKESYKPDYIILLQPTSPLRVAKDINKCIKLLEKSNADSIETFCEVTDHPAHIFKITRKGYAKPLDKQNYLKRGQDLPKVYKENGAIFIAKRKVILENNSFYGNLHKGHIMPKERSIDIDEEIDFKVTEELIKKNEKNKDLQ